MRDLKIAENVIYLYDLIKPLQIISEAMLPSHGGHAVVANTFNPRIQEMQTGGSLLV